MRSIILLFLLFFCNLQARSQAVLRCEGLLLEETQNSIVLLETQKSVINYISASISDVKAEKVVNEFMGVYRSSIGENLNQVMTEAQFSKIFLGLYEIANRYNIKLETKNDLVGVFPESLYLVKTSGFSVDSSTLLQKQNSSVEVNFLKRHELAHLFHVLALRVILIENRIELSELSHNQIESYLKYIEGGNNYLEFEKIVTDISGALHVIDKKSALNLRYEIKLKVLFDGLRIALKAGKVHFDNGWTPVEMYAKFISKAPLVVGRSLKDMLVRMSFMMFIEFYLIDDSFKNYVNHMVGNFLGENIKKKKSKTAQQPKRSLKRQCDVLSL